MVDPELRPEAPLLCEREPNGEGVSNPTVSAAGAGAVSLSNGDGIEILGRGR